MDTIEEVRLRPGCHPISRPLKPLQGLEGVYPIIDVDGVFPSIPGADENKAGFQRQLFIIAEQMLKAKGVPVLLTHEDVSLCKGHPFLTISVALTQTGFQPEEIAACMSSVMFTEFVFTERSIDLVPGILWESRSVSIGNPNTIYAELGWHIAGLVERFGDDYNEAQKLPAPSAEEE